MQNSTHTYLYEVHYKKDGQIDYQNIRASSVQDAVQKLKNMYGDICVVVCTSVIGN